jgi:hypothetical protein
MSRAQRPAHAGTTPSRGSWGIRALYDASGRRTGPVERDGRRRLERVLPILGAMWRATWGDYTGVETLRRRGSLLPRIPVPVVPTVRPVERRLLSTQPSPREGAR